MAKKLQKLASALDKQSWAWLQDYEFDVAVAIELEVAAGATPEEIKRYILLHFPDRSGLASRAMSAARYLETLGK